MKVVCITNDVEATTIQGEVYNKEIAQQVLHYALPRVLALYEKYNVHATFYCLASYIKDYPEIVHMIEQAGHEVACHGLVHDSDKAFDVLSANEQLLHLTQAKEILDDIALKPIVSFRAPALRVNSDTPMALIQSGFKTDSSIAPQRGDVFMSFGSKNKLQWLGAPREIYNTSLSNLARRGNSGIAEIPVSAFGLPYISTLMRMSRVAIAWTRWMLWMETKRDNKKVVNFLFHPGEIIPGQGDNAVVRRAKNPIKHFLVGVLRAKLKKKNLGESCEVLLERELQFWTRKGYEFKTVSEISNLL